jgi:hypothetical protein
VVLKLTDILNVVIVLDSVVLADLVGTQSVVIVVGGRVVVVTIFVVMQEALQPVCSLLILNVIPYILAVDSIPIAVLILLVVVSIHALYRHLVVSVIGTNAVQILNGFAIRP